MQSFAQWMLQDGLLPLMILVMVGLEAIGLVVLRRWFAVGPGLAPMVGSLASGACLVAALYMALTGGATELILLCLAASFVVHLADLGARFRDSASHGLSQVSAAENDIRARGSV